MLLASLAGGASTIISASPSIPATLPAGTYFIGAIADPGNAIIETNEANNSRAGNTIVTSTSPVDLTMTAVSGPTTARDGQSITLTATVANLGHGKRPGLHDPVVSVHGQHHHHGGYAARQRDDPGARRRCLARRQHHDRSSASVPAGTYRFGVIADPDNLIAETNKTNNAGPTLEPLPSAIEPTW